MTRVDSLLLPDRGALLAELGQQLEDFLVRLGLFEGRERLAGREGLAYDTPQSENLSIESHPIRSGHKVLDGPLDLH